MALFSFLTSLLGASAAKSASRKAEAAQQGFLGQALAQEQQQRDITRADFSPWRTEGGAALTGQGDLLGLHGADPQAAAIAQLQGSPLYQTLFRNGLEANLQNASATGGIRGGNEVRSLADFGRDTLAQTIQQQLGNLGSVSGQGLTAAGMGAQSGDALTQAIAQILGNQGQVAAGGILTRGGINQANWNNLGSAFGSGGGGLSSLLGAIPGIGGILKSVF